MPANKRSMADQGESTVVMVLIVFCALTMYVMGHEWVSRHMLGMKHSGAGKVVGNYPLRITTTSESNAFDQVSTKQKRDREGAMRDFMRKVYSLSESGKLEAVFGTETGDKANWWNRMYSLKSMYEEPDGRGMPVSFALCATDQVNKSKFTLAGRVTNIVVESEKDFLDPGTSGTSFKVYVTLRDDYWANREDPASPRDVKYVFTQTARGHGTSVVIGSDGNTLPIFVNFFGIRLEKETVVLGDDILGRFKTEGLGMQVNKEERASKLNTPLASVRFHENKGDDILFMMKTVDQIFADRFEYVRAMPDESDGTFIHRLAARDGEVLPMLLRVADRATPIKALTVSTVCDESDPDGMDLVLDVWVRLVTDQTMQLVGPRNTRDWKMMDPVVPEEEQYRLVKFTVGDSVDLILLSNNKYEGSSLVIPDHNERMFVPFKKAEYPGGVSYDWEAYNIAQYNDQSKPYYNMSLGDISEQNFGTVGVYSNYAYAWIALFVVCVLLGARQYVSQQVFKVTDVVGKLGVGAGVGIVALGIHMMRRDRFDLSQMSNKLIFGCMVFIAIGLLIQVLCMSVSGVPSGRAVVVFVISSLVFSIYFMLTGGNYEFKNKKVVDEDVMTEKSHTFYMVTTLLIACGLGVVQTGALLYSMKTSYTDLKFGARGPDYSTVQVCVQLVVFVLMLWVANYKRAEETEEIDPTGLDFQRTALGVLTLFGMMAWTQKDRFGTEIHTTHNNGHAMEGENTMLFFGKYAILLGAIYAVLGRMVQSSLEMDNKNQLCVRNRHAMKAALDDSNDAEHADTRGIRSFIADQLSKHGCVTNDAKEPVVIFSSMVLLMVIMSNSGSARQQKVVDVSSVFGMTVVACMTVVASAWLCDTKKQEYFTMNNPVYALNKGRVIVDEWSFE